MTNLYLIFLETPILSSLLITLLICFAFAMYQQNYKIQAIGYCISIFICLYVSSSFVVYMANLNFIVRVISLELILVIFMTVSLLPIIMFLVINEHYRFKIAILIACISIPFIASNVVMVSTNNVIWRNTMKTELEAYGNSITLYPASECIDNAIAKMIDSQQKCIKIQAIIPHNVIDLRNIRYETISTILHDTSETKRHRTLVNVSLLYTDDSKETKIKDMNINLHTLEILHPTAFTSP